MTCQRVFAFLQHSATKHWEKQCAQLCPWAHYVASQNNVKMRLHETLLRAGICVRALYYIIRARDWHLLQRTLPYRVTSIDTHW